MSCRVSLSFAATHPSLNKIVAVPLKQIMHFELSYFYLLYLAETARALSYGYVDSTAWCMRGMHVL